MGQVPKSEENLKPSTSPCISSLLLVGNGKLSRHLKFYFDSLNIPSVQWNRQDHTTDQLKLYFEKSKVCFLLIKDDALDPFLNQHPWLQNPKTFHCSGAANISGINCIHPLMTFSNELYSLEFYRQIPWATFAEDFSWLQVHPSIKNPIFYIDPKNKVFYHSLCVIMGNFSQILWSLALDSFQKNLNLNPSHLQPYMQQISRNFWHEYSHTNPKLENILTGPIARKDFKTLQSHLQILENTPLMDIYLSFLRATIPSSSLENLIIETLNCEESKKI